MTRRRILFVCRASSAESAKTAQAIAALDNVEVVTTDVSGVESLLALASTLRAEHGSLDQIVTAQETLLEVVALANEALGLPGLSVTAIRRTLDKSQLKATLHQAGLNTPRYEVVTGSDRAYAFAGQIGFPVVLKSVAGSGALATFLVNSDDALQRVLHESVDPFLAEQYITGQELCIDTITINNEPRFHSICCYQPSILAAVENPETQWSCVMPRDLTPYHDFIEQGLKAIRALNVGNAMTHMEALIDANGRAWFTDATLRPAGARIAPMLAHAYDIDPYRAWARVAVDGCFDGPWERKYAVGTIFLRGLGAGTVAQVDGIERVEQECKDVLVDARWPRVGITKSATYTGDGFVTVRHRETEAVQTVLQRIAKSIKITYSSDSQLPAATWEHRLQNFHELNRPVWDQAN
jgi:biotin carboxylase